VAGRLRLSYQVRTPADQQLIERGPDARLRGIAGDCWCQPELTGRAPCELGCIWLDLAVAAPADRDSPAVGLRYCQLGIAAGVRSRPRVRQQLIDAPPPLGC
jgi:hypothetical protein